MAKNNPTRRDFVKTAGVAAAAASAFPAPAIQKVRAANDQVLYGVIGTGGRGTYLLRHLRGIDSGRCVAVCDVYEPALKNGVAAAGTNPAAYKDYRELLARKDIDAVLIATPLYLHFAPTRDALQAGKHVFCEKSLARVQAGRGACSARPRPPVPETGATGGTPAPLQPVLPDRQADD